MCSGLNLDSRFISVLLIVGDIYLPRERLHAEMQLSKKGLTVTRSFVRQSEGQRFDHGPHRTSDRSLWLRWTGEQVATRVLASATAERCV